MKYQIVNIIELGNETIPCYDITVRQIPNFLERLFGAHEQEFKCVSDFGIDWYRLPEYEKIKFKTKLDDVLITIPMSKRRNSVQKLFDSIREIKAKNIVDDARKFN